ncbi:MAG: SGNH/GDSL hydrolase family protein [Blastocatellia bacterium]
MKTHLPAKLLFRCLHFLAFLWLPLSTAAQTAFPEPQTLGPVESYGRNIQRTMTLLATSTPQRRNTVRILFYGQSITEQRWSKLVAEDLRRRFPHANLIIENRAIGGHSSPRLVKTMESDVFPFYPDLVIFHVYGDDGDYERLIRAIRARTTAEILLQTDHLRRNDDLAKEETDPAKITRGKTMWDSWMNYVFLPHLAREVGAELVNQRELWKAYLRDHQLTPGQLLQDDVHLNQHGNYLMAEIVRAYLRYDPKLKRAGDAGAVTTYQVGQDLHWRGGKLSLPFEGNRVDVIVGKGSAKPAEVRIDDRAPSSFPELYAFNRVTHYPQSTWPTMLRVQAGKPLLVEDWALTLTELSADYKQVKFTLAGSRTGADGTGVSTERFVSNSGRVVIEPDDWNLEYCLRVFKRPLNPDFNIEWKVMPQFVDEFVAPALQEAGLETVVTLAQGLPNGKHRLEISGDAKTPIAAIRVYRPVSLKQ